MVIAAIVSILVTVPKGKSVERVEPAPAKRVDPNISGEVS